MTPLLEEYLEEAIYGSIDGMITTFSIIAGALGGGLAPRVILILGLSNVLSDGFSMGASSQMSAVTAREKGRNGKDPITVGTATFLAFVILGLVPLFPFLLFPVGVAKQVALVATAAMFFIIGLVKGKILNKPAFFSGATTFGVGMGAAVIAQAIGIVLGGGE